LSIFVLDVLDVPLLLRRRSRWSFGRLVQSGNALIIEPDRITAVEPGLARKLARRAAKCRG